MLVCALFALGVLGCEAGDPADEAGEEIGEEPALLCDGSQDLRLAWFVGGGGQVVTEMQRELGFAYLYVRGDCRYWVLPYQGPPALDVREARTGVLDAGEAAELAEMLDYGNLAALAAEDWPQQGGEDGPTNFLHDGEDLIACTDTCLGAPESVQTMTTAGPDYFLELWEAGEPMSDAPMRIQARFLGGAPTDDVPVWDLGLDLSEVDTTPIELSMQGTSTLVDDPEIAAALRQFRAQNPEATAYYEPIVVNDSGGAYEVFVRDALPLENEQGLIAWPSP